MKKQETLFSLNKMQEVVFGIQACPDCGYPLSHSHISDCPQCSIKLIWRCCSDNFKCYLQKGD